MLHLDLVITLGCTWDRGSTPGEVDNLGTVAHGAEVTNLAEADRLDAVTDGTVVQTLWLGGLPWCSCIWDRVSHPCEADIHGAVSHRKEGAKISLNYI